ncbi:alanine racemase [Hyphobacterium sp.]|uniref:alanine racemase n=1 Tax=Hyphobacterium sp. TaxID=2004662 RepID=UPI003B52425E
MLATPRLTVDLDAVAANYRRLREAVAPVGCAGVIKADAYGLGAVNIGRRLLAENCHTFFFAHPGEAIELAPEIRAAGGRCLILNGLGQYNSAVFLENGLIPVLNSLQEAQSWLASAGAEAAALHLDTGMNRLGLPPEDDAAVRGLQANGLNLVHLMSHFACADQPERKENREQIRRFEARSAAFAIAERSMANSAGCLLGTDAHFDLVRPGLALYGAQPAESGRINLAIPYRFEAPVLQVRPVKAGEAAGYGGTHRFQADGWAATIGAGYADGLPRAFSNAGSVRLELFQAPIIGRVSMDSTIVDVSGHPDPETLHGTNALIYGPGLAVDAQAAAAGLSSYELLTRIGGRTERIYGKLA